MDKIYLLVDCDENVATYFGFFLTEEEAQKTCKEQLEAFYNNFTVIAVDKFSN